MSQGPALQKGVEYEILKDLLGRAEEARRVPPRLWHMLVLPPGESIRVPERSGARLLGARGRAAAPGAVTRFGPDRVAAALPPRDSWPPFPPARAVVAEEEMSRYRPCTQVPYRVHLFFGDGGALPVLERLARDLTDLASTAARELPGDPVQPLRRIYRGGDALHGRAARALDSWLCTVHWWAWYADMPVRARPQVVTFGKGYDVDPLKPLFEELPSFSRLDRDVLTATAETIRLLLRFYDVPPELGWGVKYPPTPRPACDEAAPVPEASTTPAPLPPSAPVPFPAPVPPPAPAGQCGVVAATPQVASPPTAGPTPELDPAWEVAHATYVFGERKLLELGVRQFIDDDVYEWLKEQDLGDYELPDRDTWKRYLRRVRNARGEQKHRPRRGRTSRSVRRPDEF